jgi:hypothetical protein
VQSITVILIPVPKYHRKVLNSLWSQKFKFQFRNHYKDIITCQIDTRTRNIGHENVWKWQVCMKNLRACIWIFKYIFADMLIFRNSRPSVISTLILRLKDTQVWFSQARIWIWHTACRFARLRVILTICVWFVHFACDLHTHDCDFITLRIELLY